MLDKLGGVFAPKPSSGPHKTRECLPMIIFLRNRLKYALTYVEARKICKQRLIQIDGRVRTDFLYPAGFMGLFNTAKEIFILKFTRLSLSRCHYYRKNRRTFSFNL